MSAASCGWAHVRAYCTCGSKLDVRAEPAHVARDIQEMWRSLHVGEGHGSCDAATARRARALRADSQEDKT